MFISNLFSKTTKHAPKDEVSRNATLLIRAGFIHKEMAGVYSLLPLGLRVLNKIQAIIREEMNTLGGQEVFLTTLQDKKVWQASDRWDDQKVDNWFKTKLKNKTEVGLGFTHEEALSNILTNHISSYKDLPVYIYQFQTKFRNELRAKSGIMRTREFMMKDLYSFNRTEAGFKKFYEQCADSYQTIFERVGLGDITFRTFASGGSFSQFSDEFQTVSEAGEDTIYINDQKKIAVNKEVYNDEVLAELGLDKKDMREAKSIEVGNIFPLGSKYSDSQNLYYKDEQGKKQSIFMGSYGIGLGRLIGTIAEVYADDKGLVWPETVAPFLANLIVVAKNESDPAFTKANHLHDQLNKKKIEVLFDNRLTSAGDKLAQADLIGIPYRLVISAKTGDQVEVKRRDSDKAELMSVDAVIKLLSR